MNRQTVDGQDACSEKRIQEKLTELLDQAERMHPFGKNNFVALQKLTFLWIIGDNKDSLDKLEEDIKYETREIVRDIRTVCIIPTLRSDLFEKTLYQSVSDYLDKVSGEGLELKNLFEVIICPVLLSEETDMCEDSQIISENCLCAQRELRKRSRSIEWHPFLVLRDKEVDYNRRQVKIFLSAMNDIIADARKSHQQNCFPCCLLSDINERGQGISMEQNAETLVMMMAFQNTVCEDEADMRTVLQPLGTGDEDYFFTARAISIGEPVQSILLNRMLAVHNRFRRGIVSQEGIFEDWGQGFFHSGEWREILEKIPHDDQNRIMTQSIYSNVPVANARDYENNLRNFCRRYYFDPVEKGLRRTSGLWWDYFWEEYFFRRRGAPDTLKELEEKRPLLTERVPQLMPAPHDMGMISGNDLRMACEQWLIKELAGKPRQMVEWQLSNESDRMQQIRVKRDKVSSQMDHLGEILNNRIMALGQSELLLNTGGGVSASALDEAARWLNEKLSDQEINDSYIRYQKMFYDYFRKNDPQAADVMEELLSLYSDIVLESVESRGEYMRSKLAVLAGTDLKQLVARLEENWKYPVHLSSGFGKDINQKLYLMGSRKNAIYQKLKTQTLYSIAFIENVLDERMEIVRVSDRFSENEIFAEGIST